MSQSLSCPQGHHWTVADQGETLPDSSLSCPECGAQPLPPTLPTSPLTGRPPSTEPAAPLAFASCTARPSGYEILEELGRGGMGVVYKAMQLGLKRVVALKMIRAGSLAGSDDLRRFRSEAEAVARLRHPNIIQIHEIGEVGGEPFLSLEYVEGGSLAGKVRAGPVAPRETAGLIETLARAMQHAHDQGVVHRDLKPANVLLTADGSPRITDFGLAKSLSADGDTQTGAILGTPSYMAPEQAEGRKDVGPAADVYALGAILYECLTTQPPFKAATSIDTLIQVRTLEPTPPRQLAREAPRDLETICLKCLHKDPHKRYVSAAALADDLRRWLDGQPIQARPVGRLGRAWRWSKRNPAVAGLLLAVILTLATGAAVASFFAVQAHRTAEELKEALRERDLARERIRGRMVAARLVRYLREHHDMARDKPPVFVAAFLKANPDLSLKDLADAFPAPLKREGALPPEPGAEGPGSFSPSMFGD
jgi:hypothetical protein